MRRRDGQKARKIGGFADAEKRRKIAVFWPSSWNGVFSTVFSTVVEILGEKPKPLRHAQTEA